MAALTQHAHDRHAPADGQRLRYRDGRPITSGLRHTTLTWVERNFGHAVARAFAGNTDSGDPNSTATYVRATVDEVATALAALTGEPHPLAIP